MRAAPACALLVLAAACATPAPEASAPALLMQAESVVPGTIGILVKAGPAGVIIDAVGRDGPAAAAGVRVGDQVLRYNGVPVDGSRQLYGLMLESAPGSSVQVELMREGRTHRLDVPVREIDTALRLQTLSTVGR